MHFHQKSTNQLSNSIKALLLILITYSSTCYAISDSEIAEVIANFDLDTPGRYCGKRLTDAMKVFCIPSLRRAILAGSEDSLRVDKKSCELIFNIF